MKIKSIKADSSRPGVYTVDVTITKPKTAAQLMRNIANPPMHSLKKANTSKK